MLYLDHAATSFPKPKPVLRAIRDAVLHYGGNPGRSGHRLSLRTADAVFAVREKIVRFLGYGKPECVFFTENATQALNFAIKGTLGYGDVALLSPYEHNAVWRPVEKCAKERGVRYFFFPEENAPGKHPDEPVSPVRAVISTLCSNVCGKKYSLPFLLSLAKRHGAKTIVDASQFLGHAPLDLSAGAPDYLCAPGHKGLFGMMGCGFCLAKTDDSLDTLIEGGSGSYSQSPEMPENLPERMEAGTIPVPAILSLGAGIDFLSAYGMENIRKALDRTADAFRERLLSLPGVRLYAEEKSDVLSFTLEGHTPEEVGEHLDRDGIATRSGLHCAPLAHKTLGTLESGTVRVSISVFERASDADRLYRSLKSLVSV